MHVFSSENDRIWDNWVRAFFLILRFVVFCAEKSYFTQMPLCFMLVVNMEAAYTDEF